MVRKDRMRHWLGFAGMAAAMILPGRVGAQAVQPGQPVLVAGQPAGGQMALSLRTQPGRMYRWETSTGLAGWGNLPVGIAGQVPLVAPLVAGESAMSLNVPVGVPKEFFRVKESAPFDPPWADVKPLRTIAHAYNASATTLVNGTALKTAMAALVAGDRLEIAPGTYSFNGLTNLSIQGTAAAPIRMVAPQGGVKLTRTDVDQTVLTLGSSAPLRYVAIEGIEMTGGGGGLMVRDAANLWINRCTLHNFSGTGILANTVNTSYLYITRNEISDALNDGDGICLGATDGSIVASNCVIALNAVHDTSGTQSGEGIELKRGSWGNLISGNVVHDTASVGILLWPGSASGVNTVENNVVHAAGDYGMAANSHCVVRNNLSVGNVGEAFYCSTLSSISPTNASVVHNTFMAGGGNSAARLGNWNTGTGLVFANNACYSQTGAAIQATGGTGTTVFAGLVAYGAATGIPIAAVGTGLGDFVNLSWNGANRNATPSSSSPLKGAASAGQVTEYDLDFYLRTAPHVTGCHR